jgi:septum formation protein
MQSSLILGSSSPRRQEIMRYFSYPFTVASPPFDESQVPYTGDPNAYVTTLAFGKAKSLKDTYPNEVILTADTMVVIDGELLGKPKDDVEMRKMLAKLSGRWHTVYTGVAVASPKTIISHVEKTEVLCNTLSPEDIHRYMRGIMLHDKAGSYAIQGSGCLLVNKIDGCYYNVMGLPVNSVRKLLFTVGIDLWNYL